MAKGIGLAVDPIGLDFTLDSKTVDKPNRTAEIRGSIYWNGVKKATFTLTLDAKDQSKAVGDFGYGFQLTPV